MSHLTDLARAAARAQDDSTAVDAAPGQRFDELLNDARVPRRALLRGGVAGSIAAMLAACGGGGDDGLESAQARLGNKFKVGFKPVAESSGDTVVVPEGYRAQVLFSAGDAVAPGAIAYSGSYLASSDAEKVAGGNHDGMCFYELPGVNPNQGGLLAINHEFPDFAILMSGGYDANDTSAAGLERKRLALSAVGVSVIEVERVGNGFQERWQVVAGSKYNRRYSGNTLFAVSGPGASSVGASVVGTLNNCASGMTPWGTYLTCEETTDNYLDPTQNSLGYGWVVEIDPYGELANMPVKRTALGRFDHENTAYLMAADGTLAIYMGDDSTPGCIYKFVSDRKVDRANRAANANLLDSGTLYAARFNADGTGRWIELTQGKNGLVAGATDPGNTTQGPQTATPIDFTTQADVLINTKAAARVAGATLMDRPEWISVAPDRSVFVTLTNNSGRQVTDAANPRVQNRHGHIVRWQEAGKAPDAVTFTWELVLQAGDPSLANAAGNLVGDIVGDTFSSPDGIGVDPAGRCWVQTDMSVPGNSGISGVTNVAAFGNNAMYWIDPATRESRRFLVGPVGCEITGLAWTPDLRTFFINIQHPTQAWPSNVQGNGLPARSSTIVVRRDDGQAVGA
jgi:secreted PhoX family phosphatase